MRELSLGGSNAALVPEEGGEKGGLSQTQDRRGLIWGLLLLGLLRSGSHPQVNLLQLLHEPLWWKLVMPLGHVNLQARRTSPSLNKFSSVQSTSFCSPMRRP